MARRIDYSARYLHPAERVYAALADADHWDARVTEMRKYSENRIEEFSVTDSGIDIVLHHVLPRSNLPDIAQAVMRNDLIITRRERYGRFEVTATGRYEASIPAGPGSLTGTMELSPTESGSVLKTTSEAKVNIPFVGGKLEELILTNLLDVFRNEAIVTAEWLGRP